jgi:hypothetical protein
MEGVIAVDDAGASRGGAGELDRGFDRFGARIGEERLVEIRHSLEQPLRQHAGEG